jgi:hypothetical protein
MPLIYHHDLEVECEILEKPCNYDDHPDAKQYVSSKLTQAQSDRAMLAIKKNILASSSGLLAENLVSKAERGFNELDNTVEALSRHLVNTLNIEGGPQSLRSAFALSAGNENPADPPPKLHKSLPRSMSYVLQERSIAFRR